MHKVEYEVSWSYNSFYVPRYSFTNEAEARDFAEKVMKGFGSAYVTIAKISTDLEIVANSRELDIHRPCPNKSVVSENYANSGTITHCIHEEGHASACFFAAVPMKPIGDPGCNSGWTQQ